jgi:membrane-associated protease RseP (regulator of RpoE activity)
VSNAEKVSVGISARVENVRLVAGSGVRVRLKCVDYEDAAPVAGVAVKMSGGGIDYGEGVTDERGELTLVGLPAAATAALSLSHEPVHVAEPRFEVTAPPEGKSQLDLGTVRLVRKKSMEEPSGMIGMVVERGPSGVMVGRTVPESPAALAGLKPGHLLLAADGRSLAGVGVAGARYLLRGRPGTELALAVAGADGNRQEIRITRAAAQ